MSQERKSLISTSLQKSDDFWCASSTGSKKKKFKEQIIEEIAPKRKLSFPKKTLQMVALA